VYLCDLVAISTFSAQIFEAYAIADRLPASGRKSRDGRAACSVQPDEALQHADYVVIAREKRSDRLWWKQQRTGPGLQSSRRPISNRSMSRGCRRRVIHSGSPGYNRYTVQTNTWLSVALRVLRLNRDATGHRIAAGPFDQVARDRNGIEQLYPRPSLSLADDNTFVAKPWSKELPCAHAVNVKWFTETDISVADDEEPLELMYRSGCRQVLIGLESPSAGPLAGWSSGLTRRPLGSPLRRGHSHDPTHGVAVSGMASFWDWIEQTTERVREILQFVEEVAPFDVQITLLTPFPAHRVERLLKEERVLQPGAWQLCTLFDENYRPTRMTSQELREGIFSGSADNSIPRSYPPRRRKGFSANSAHERSLYEFVGWPVRIRCTLSLAYDGLLGLAFSWLARRFSTLSESLRRTTGVRSCQCGLLVIFGYMFFSIARRPSRIGIWSFMILLKCCYVATVGWTRTWVRTGNLEVFCVCRRRIRRSSCFVEPETAGSRQREHKRVRCGT